VTQYFAFLRAINVGGHTVKMDLLRELFESLNLLKVETFIASGNVVFESSSKDSRTLENKIETKLNETLGYEVATFIRTGPELDDIVAYQAFPQLAFNSATAFNIAFLREPPNKSQVSRLMALQTEIDDFSVNNREIYWLCQKKQSESTFSNAILEKALGIKSTLRGVNTVKKLTGKYILSHKTKAALG
jgi:uncharacterized protein (DUF1697 family)